MTMIVAGTDFDPESVIQADLDFHLGQRDDYEVRSVRSVCQQHQIADPSFVCFQKSPPEFFGSEFFQNSCRLTFDKIECDIEITYDKHLRTLRTINRDYALMADTIPFAFALRDRRLHDYRKIFQTQKPIPVFQYHRHKSLKAIIHPLSGYHEYPSKNIPRVPDVTPLSKKKSVMFWRGNLAGVVKTEAENSSLSEIVSSSALSDDQRVTFLRKSARYMLAEQGATDDRLDVGMVFPFQQGDMRHHAVLSNLIKSRATVSEHFSHRYLLALDGYDGPSSWYWMLNSNSVVIRQKSDWLMFGDSYFVPWVHFVPIAEDASDIMDVFDWCEKNQATCEKISSNAKAAWAVLFDPIYQVERRKALFQAYRDWLD